MRVHILAGAALGLLAGLILMWAFPAEQQRGPSSVSDIAPGLGAVFLPRVEKGIR